MTSQHHESMKTLISGLNITSYQGRLKTILDETERKTIQTLLRDEEVWLRQHTPKAFEWGSKRSVQVALADKKSQRAATAAAALAHIDGLLDDALKATFPASDPVAISIERGADERERLKSSREERQS